MASHYIKFIADDEETLRNVGLPSPAVKEVPDWYKNASRFKDSNKPSFGDRGEVESTMKGCMPVFDSMTMGYTQKTWTDIFIERDDSGEVTYRWSRGPEIMRSRPVYQHATMPTPAGCSQTMFTWNRPWGVVVPRGYSVMFTHPAYRYDLPFVSGSGVIDADRYHSAGKNSVPFYLKDDFTGLIPAGTPMFQMIPFKRDSWEATKHGAELAHLKDDSTNTLRTKFYDGYKKLFWSRKEFS